MRFLVSLPISFPLIPPAFLQSTISSRNGWRLADPEHTATINDHAYQTVPVEMPFNTVTADMQYQIKFYDARSTIEIGNFLASRQVDIGNENFENLGRSLIFPGNFAENDSFFRLSGYHPAAQILSYSYDMLELKIGLSADPVDGYEPLPDEAIPMWSRVSRMILLTHTPLTTTNAADAVQLFSQLTCLPVVYLEMENLLYPILGAEDLTLQEVYGNARLTVTDRTSPLVWLDTMDYPPNLCCLGEVFDDFVERTLRNSQHCTIYPTCFSIPIDMTVHLGREERLFKNYDESFGGVYHHGFTGAESAYNPPWDRTRLVADAPLHVATNVNVWAIRKILKKAHRCFGADNVVNKVLAFGATLVQIKIGLGETHSAAFAPGQNPYLAYAGEETYARIDRLWVAAWTNLGQKPVTKILSRMSQNTNTHLLPHQTTRLFDTFYRRVDQADPEKSWCDYFPALCISITNIGVWNTDMNFYDKRPVGDMQGMTWEVPNFGVMMDAAVARVMDDLRFCQTVHQIHDNPFEIRLRERITAADKKSVFVCASNSPNSLFFLFRWYYASSHSKITLGI